MLPLSLLLLSREEKKEKAELYGKFFKEMKNNQRDPENNKGKQKHSIFTLFSLVSPSLFLLL